jgi:hypothetical protein
MTLGTNHIRTWENENNGTISHWPAQAVPSSWGFSTEGNYGAATVCGTKILFKNYGTVT